MCRVQAKEMTCGHCLRSRGHAEGCPYAEDGISLKSHLDREMERAAEHDRRIAELLNRGKDDD